VLRDKGAQARMPVLPSAAPCRQRKWDWRLRRGARQRTEPEESVWQLRFS